MKYFFSSGKKKVNIGISFHDLTIQAIGGKYRHRKDGILKYPPIMSFFYSTIICSVC